MNITIKDLNGRDIKLKVSPILIDSLISIFFVSAALGDLVSGDPDTETGTLIGLLMFFLGVGCASGYLAYVNFRSQPAQPTKQLSAEQKERIILQLAQENGGTLTVARVAAASEMTIQESKSMLEALSLEGVCEVSFAEDGSVHYTFKGL